MTEHKTHHRVHHASHQAHQTNHIHHKRGFMKHLMENKGLVTAIIVVFVLIIAVGGYVLFTGEEEPAVSEQVSSLVATCDEWCSNEQINEWCDFELAADTGRGSCYGFANSPLYTDLGVQKCGAIDCNNRPVEDNTCVEGLGGVWETPDAEGECSSVNGITRFTVSSTDEPPISGKVCCVE